MSLDLSKYDLQKFVEEQRERYRAKYGVQNYVTVATAHLEDLYKIILAQDAELREAMEENERLRTSLEECLRYVPTSTSHGHKAYIQAQQALTRKDA